GTSRLFGNSSTPWIKQCFTTMEGRWPAIHEARANDPAPWAAVIGVTHTTDPLGYLVNHTFPGAAAAQASARAPRRDTAVTYSVFSAAPAGGVPPILDAQRSAALKGEFQQSPTDDPRDYSVLVSCGPFQTLGPGQNVMFAVAFLTGETPDSLVEAAQFARLAWRGLLL